MRRLKESEDWKWAKEKLKSLMDTMNSLVGLPKDRDERDREIDSRIKAIGLVSAWIEEVEGTGIQQQFNAKETKIINNELLTRFGE